MHPTNRAERRKASLNFMLLFLVCTGIIITTVFYSTRIPLKQNEQLVAYKNTVTKRDELKSNFTDKLISISAMIDSLGNKTPAEIIQYSVLIDKEIAELGSLLPNTTDDDTKLYTNVMKNLSNYYEDRKTVKKGIETTSKEKEYEMQIAQLKTQSTEIYNQLLVCQGLKSK
jgi:Type VI secretion system, TssO